MEEVEKEFNTTYDPNEPVEAYFMRIQDARSHAALLGQPYTETQVMNKALKQFETHYEKDAYKAEKKWNEKLDSERSWTTFKAYWKDEIHQWETMAGGASKGAKKIANQAIDLSSIMESINELRAETRSVREANSAIHGELEFQRALQADQRSRHRDDDISTITNQLDSIERQRQCSSPNLGLSSFRRLTKSR